MSKRGVALLSVWSAQRLNLNHLIHKIKDGMRPLVCQECGNIIAREEDALASVPGVRACPECRCDELVMATPDTLNEAFDSYHPFSLCAHCGYYFLWDDDIARLIEPDPDKAEGMMGCPNCNKLTS